MKTKPITPEERQILHAALARGRKVAMPKGREPRNALANHTVAAESWMQHLKNLHAIYGKLLAGKIALQFLASESHPMNPDTMEIIHLK